jgi:hypothetical protein
MDKLVLTGISHPATFELDEGLISVGRNPTNDFRVSDPTVSSFHCELIVSRNSVLVRDLNSTNGTFIDDQAVQEAVLRAGQVLRLGEARLRLEDQAAQEPVVIAIPQIEPERPPTQTHLLDGSLACLNHPGIGAVVRCTKCGMAFCGDCVRTLRIQGGQSRLFCPSCSGPCDLLVPKPPAKKPSFLGRLTQTIRMRFK